MIFFGLCRANVPQYSFHLTLLVHDLALILPHTLLPYYIYHTKVFPFLQLFFQLYISSLEAVLLSRPVSKLHDFQHLDLPQLFRPFHPRFQFLVLLLGPNLHRHQMILRLFCNRDEIRVMKYLLVPYHHYHVTLS